MLKRWRTFFSSGVDADSRLADAMNIAATRFAEGDAVEAEKLAEIIVSNHSSYVPARLLKAKIQSQRGKNHDVLDTFRFAPKNCFKNAEFLVAYAQLLQKFGNIEDAEFFFRKAAKLDVVSTASERALAGFLLNLERNQEAFDVFGDLLGKEPSSRDLAAWYGQTAFNLYRYAIAAEYLERAHNISPLDTLGVFLLGASLMNCGRMSEAEDVILRELSARPESSCLEWLLGLKHLLCGDWEVGFRLYERRYEAVRDFPELFGGGVFEAGGGQCNNALRWQGESIEGKKLLISLEEGLGDAVMNFRFLRVLIEEYRVAQISLVGNSHLQDLIESNSDIYSGKVIFLEERGFNSSLHDFRCSIMSLPFLLEIRPDKMRGAVPYLKSPENKSDRWKQRLCQISGVKVGLAWAGNPKMPLDALRSLSLSLLAPLFSCAEITFVSLQKDRDAQDELCVSGLRAIDWMGECLTLSDTAALINSLDLIISVDTVVAHLAGALGRPVWLLNRYESEWRWMRGKSTSVWYPSMRIYSQTESRNWEEVVSRVKNDLVSWGREYRALAHENRGFAL